MVVVERQKSVKNKLKKLEKNHCSLMLSLQWTQKELGRVKGELKEENVLTASIREATKPRRRGRVGHRRKLEEMTKRPRYDLCVQECFYGSALVSYSPVSEYAKLETPELYPDWKRLARSWTDYSKIVRESGEKSVFGAAREEIDPRCPLQLAWNARP